ncbi:hypothetical protein OQA88_11093 [Cercophora sp. LCS_1]
MAYPKKYAARFDARTHQWRAGDIAFLKPEVEFTDAEYQDLRKPSAWHPEGYLHGRATGHPVIIVSRISANSTHVTVTTVSAYSSGPANDFLPPWKQNVHRHKNRLDFRSFRGSEVVPGTKYPALTLRGGKAMPKPQASWVYIQSYWVVPLTVLKEFNKPTELLQVDTTSLASLRTHMAARCTAFPCVEALLVAYEPRPSAAAPSPRSSTPRHPVAAATASVSRLTWQSTATTEAGAEHKPKPKPKPKPKQEQDPSVPSSSSSLVSWATIARRKVKPCRVVTVL